MPLYRIDEGEFHVPDEWRDASINILSVGDSRPATFSFVITREPLREGEELLGYADRQLSQLAQSMQGFKLVEQRQREIDGALALEAEFHWLADEGKMAQRQIYLVRGRTALILTATGLESLTETQYAEVDAILSSFRLRRDA